jgi:hypothetical protein
LANISVILEKNSEPDAKNTKNTCGTGIFPIPRKLNNREKQGGAVHRNTE